MKLALIVEAKTDEIITHMNELKCKKLHIIKNFYFQVCFLMRRQMKVYPKKNKN